MNYTYCKLTIILDIIMTDYGYASTSCLDTSVLNSEACTSNNWIWRGHREWTLATRDRWLPWAWALAEKRSNNIRDDQTS